MEIAAVQWTSLQDYPDRVAAVVWTPGCNLRCPFCYNAELVLPEFRAPGRRIPAREVLRGLRARSSFLDGVVFTGGEPTLQPGLADFLREVREASLEVKLDTNGTRPPVLEQLLGEHLVDYVALDIKAPQDRYSLYARPVEMSEQALLSRVEGSLSLLREGTVDYELRTTAAPGLTAGDLEAIARWVAPAPRYFLQLFVSPPASRLIDERTRGRPALAADDLRKVGISLGRLLPTYIRA